MIVTSSKVCIENMRFYARHGVMPQEQIVGGDFTVTLQAEVDMSRAMESDDIADALNYADLYQVVEREMAVPSKLLEHVAGRIGKAVFEHFPQVISLDVKVVKLNPPMGADCDGAGVELHLINNKTHGEKAVFK